MQRHCEPLESLNHSFSWSFQLCFYFYPFASGISLPLPFYPDPSNGKCQLLDLELLLNHHPVLSSAKKPKHPAQHFPRAE